MANKRHVFYSFYYQRDISRVNQIRNSSQPWLNRQEPHGIWDNSMWETAREHGKAAIERLIDDSLIGTSVTVVLIGAETAGRDYVNYEIEQSHNRNNGLVGVYIHNVKNFQGETDSRGANPFDDWYVETNGRRVYFSEMYKTYDYVLDNGYDNLGSWVEEAAVAAGR